ncbi:MAG: uroporphyrinogen-III synthase [Alphaproteobacteria bacterium]
MKILLLRNKEEATASHEHILQRLNAYSEVEIEVSTAPLFSLIAYEIPALSQNTPLITTSKNAIRVLATYPESKEHPLFVVGAASADFARSFGFKNIYIAGGDAKSLVKLIEEQQDYKKFLYLRGKDIRLNIKQYSHQDIIEHVTYELKRIENPFAHLPQDYFTRQPTLLIYSKNQARATLEALPKQSQVKLVCISPTAALPFVEAKFRYIKIAPHPNEDAMLALIEQSLN